MKMFIRWFKDFFGFYRYKLRFTHEIPKNLQEYRVYIERCSTTKENYYAHFKCPCGCGDALTLNLIADVSPVWKITGSLNSFSVYPSIWRKTACKSHFWIKDRRVKWV